nr:metalloregulator ArsR/SmtB family transcription factor [Tumebacillus amylolyticus]
MLQDCFKSLGDKTRLRILALLRVEELCVFELVEILQMSQPAISQHLRKMKSAKLLKERREGQWVFYSIEGALFPFFDSILDNLPDLRQEIQNLRAKSEKSCCS